MTRLLASTVVLRVKTHMFAWSIPPDGATPVRDRLRNDCRTLDGLCDAFAERIAYLGGRIPASFAGFAAVSSVRETEPDTVPEKIRELVADHHQVAFDGRFLISILDDPDDGPSVGLLRKSIRQHEDCATGLRTLTN